MIVWVVTHWHLSGINENTDIVAVFSSKEKAYAYIDNLHYHPANQEYECYPLEIDKEVK